MVRAQDCTPVEPEEPQALEVRTYKRLSVVAPPGTNRHRVTRVALRIREAIEAIPQRLRGEWSFIYDGYEVRGKGGG